MSLGSRPRRYPNIQQINTITRTNDVNSPIPSSIRNTRFIRPSRHRLPHPRPIPTALRLAPHPPLKILSHKMINLDRLLPMDPRILPKHPLPSLKAPSQHPHSVRPSSASAPPRTSASDCDDRRHERGASRSRRHKTYRSRGRFVASESRMTRISASAGSRRSAMRALRARMCLSCW